MRFQAVDLTSVRWSRYASGVGDELCSPGREAGPVTKSQLIDAVAQRGGLTRKRAEQVVNTIFQAMEGALIRGDRIEIRGFGSFKTKHYPAYTGRNPRTGEPILVASKVLPVFKVGRELRERLDKG